MASSTPCHACMGCPGFKGYERELTRRSNKFSRDVNWKRLEAICWKTGSSPCHLTKDIAVSHSEMIRQVQFNDGRSMEVHLSKPLYSFHDASWDMNRVLRSKVATMKFFKARTSIPVPEIYHFEPEAHDIGAPYIIMEHFSGKMAYDVHGKTNDPLYGLGTREQDRKFLRQLAAIQVEMASLKFDKIGSLYENPETGEFYIGPLCETGDGPWESSLEYYSYLANERLQDCLEGVPEETKDDASFSLPVLFERLITMYTEETSIS
ncbi:hypothetical protein N7540_002299 [Penicillium herquei]|nr:hypothetical protein N7540_002299 [Penicillium herquei]